MMKGIKIPREGELFRIVLVDEHRFEIRYGYYEESDRAMGEPVPIYPDLIKEPLYTKEGFPLITAVQSPCEYYEILEGYEDEDTCSSCKYYPNIWDEISICQCEKRRLNHTITE